MNKKLIRLTESDLHRIVKKSVNKILKEGYYDFDDEFNADDVECPSCGSNNVEPISAIDTHYRCLDCGEEFHLDGGWEPDWGAMRHESHKRKGKIINEIGDTPKGQRGLGGLHARKVLRNNDLSDDTYNYAQNARGGDKYDNRGNNENPLYHDYANGYIDYLNSHPDEYMANKRKRMSESYLHKIVKESVGKILKEMEINKTLDEDTEGYNQVMSVLNKPIWQEKLNKAWEKEKLTNPNLDWDTFEYNFAIRCLDKEREEEAKHYNKMRKIQRQLDNNTRKNV